MSKPTICSFYNNELIAVNGVLRRGNSQEGLRMAIYDMEKSMKEYQHVGTMDSEAERCFQVSMIYTHLTGDVHRKLSWQLFDTHEDFLEAHERLDNVLRSILGIIYQRSFSTEKKKLRTRKFLKKYCTRIGVWKEAEQMALERKHDGGSNNRMNTDKKGGSQN